MKKIYDLKSGENVIIEEADVLEVFDVKKIAKKDGTRVSMQEVLIDDKSGGIILKLWGDKVNTLKVNDKVRVEGYVSDFKGQLSISVAYGKIEMIK